MGHDHGSIYKWPWLVNPTLPNLLSCCNTARFVTHRASTLLMKNLRSMSCMLLYVILNQVYGLLGRLCYRRRLAYFGAQLRL